MKRAKTLTKKERKAQRGVTAGTMASGGDHHHHIHCVACGKHLDEQDFEGNPPSAVVVTCQHGSHFPSCAGCEVETKRRVDEHDRTGNQVEFAAAFH